MQLIQDPIISSPENDKDIVNEWWLAVLQKTRLNTKNTEWAENAWRDLIVCGLKSFTGGATAPVKCTCMLFLELI